MILINQVPSIVNEQTDHAINSNFSKCDSSNISSYRLMYFYRILIKERKKRRKRFSGAVRPKQNRKVVSKYAKTHRDVNLSWDPKKSCSNIYSKSSWSNAEIRKLEIHKQNYCLGLLSLYLAFNTTVKLIIQMTKLYFSDHVYLALGVLPWSGRMKLNSRNVL